MRVFRKLPMDRLVFRFTFSTYSFTDYFKGFEKAVAIQEIFGAKTESVLQNIKIQFSPLGGYMGVSNADGHMMVNPRYLNNGDKIDIHLDVIHELVHVKQHMQGKELFDTHYGYVDRPTEIEAYSHAVEEARRLGLSDERICEYLKTEWMSTQDLNRLAKTLNVQCINE